MATAATAEETGNEECSVCNDYFSQPKLLPCGHLLCRQCLLSWLKSKPQASCPLCRSSIVNPDENPTDSKTLEVFADGLPTDLAMETLIETEQLLSKDHPCQVCVSQVAKHLCVTCGDFLCSGCAPGHTRSAVTRHHAVEDLSALTAEKLASSRPCLCSVHDGEVCRVYCPTHRTTLCLLCATTTHRQCPRLMELDIKIQEDCEALADLESTLNAEETVLQQAINKLDQHLREMEKSVEEAVTEIDENCDLLDAALKATRHRLKDLCQRSLADFTEKVNGKKTRLLQRRGKLTTHNQVVHHARQVTKADVVDAMTLAMKRRVEDLNCVRQLPAGAVGVAKTVKVVIDPDVVSRLMEEMLELGQVKTCLDGVLPGAVAAAKPAVFQFHSNHGVNVALSNGNQTAERTRGRCDGIVISEEPMQTNMLYEIRLDETEDSHASMNACFGVVTTPPDTIALPWWSVVLQSAIVLSPARVWVNGVMKEKSVGSALKNATKGSRVGLLLDSEQTLYWYRDGQCEEVISQGLPDLCHVMVDLCYFWKKVTALPVQPMA